MKTDKKALFLAGIMALSLTFAACSENEESLVATSPVTTTAPEPQLIISDESTTSVVEKTEPQTTTATTEQTVQAQPDIEFDTPFEIKEGQTLTVGRGDISVTLRDVEFEEEFNLCSLYYTLKISDKAYDGAIYMAYELPDADCYEARQDEFTNNRLVAYSSDNVDTATLMLTSDTIVKEPSVLSGNADEYYTPQEPVYFEGNGYLLFVGENIKIPCDLIERMDNYISLVEEHTGFKINSSSKYAKYGDSEHSWLYNNEFIGVDPDAEQFHIYIVDPSMSSPCAFGSSIIVNPQDVDFESGEGYAIIHELAHCAHLRNGVSIESLLTEGYATYITDIVLSAHPELGFDFSSELNYSFFDATLTAENAEEVYLTLDRNGYQEYCFGYRLWHYLFETYGDSIFRDILKECGVKNPSNSSMDAQTSLECVKACTSENVMADFANWLALNTDRFDGI